MRFEISPEAGLGLKNEGKLLLEPQNEVIATELSLEGKVMK